MNKNRSIKHFLILPSYQLRLVIFMSLIVFVGTMLHALGLYLIADRNLSDHFNSTQAEQIWEILKPVVVVSNGLSFIIITIFLIIMAILISHRLIGPMLKATGYVNKLNSGVLPKDELKLREGDEGQVLCDAINKLHGNIREQISKLKELRNSVKDEAIASKIDELIADYKEEGQE